VVLYTLFVGLLRAFNNSLLVPPLFIRNSTSP
jgi:hypothetical protein